MCDFVAKLPLASSVRVCMYVCICGMYVRDYVCAVSVCIRIYVNVGPVSTLSVFVCVCVCVCVCVSLCVCVRIQ